MILFFLKMLMTLIFQVKIPDKKGFQRKELNISCCSPESEPAQKLDIEEQHLRHNKYQAHYYGLHDHHDLAKSHTSLIISSLFL